MINFRNDFRSRRVKFEEALLALPGCWGRFIRIDNGIQPLGRKLACRACSGQLAGRCSRSFSDRKFYYLRVDASEALPWSSGSPDKLDLLGPRWRDLALRMAHRMFDCRSSGGPLDKVHLLHAQRCGNSGLHANRPHGRGTTFPRGTI